MNLSIITINYNDKAGLEKTIASVMSQTWRDFEWIIIDGGSNDGSREYIESIARNPLSNISYWCSEKDNGIFNALNKGIAKATGNYINCMNSGDIFHSPKVLEDVFSEERNADVLYGDWMYVNGICHNGIDRLPSTIDQYTLYKSCMCHQAVFAKTSVLQMNPFDESYKLTADYKLWTDLSLKGATFEHLDVVICDYDLTGISSQQQHNKEIEIKRIKDSYPITVRRSMDRLDYYERYHQIQRTKHLINKGGLPKSITSLFLKIMIKIWK